jgi:hypothetical protein
VNKVSRLPMHLPRGALRITTLTRWTSGPSGRSLFEGAERGQKWPLRACHSGESTSGCTCAHVLLGASPRRDVVWWTVPLVVTVSMRMPHTTPSSASRFYLTSTAHTRPALSVMNLSVPYEWVVDGVSLPSGVYLAPSPKFSYPCLGRHAHPLY